MSFELESEIESIEVQGIAWDKIPGQTFGTGSGISVFFSEFSDSVRARVRTVDSGQQPPNYSHLYVHVRCRQITVICMYAVGKLQSRKSPG